VLAVCEGGSNAAALLVVVIAVAAWVLLAVPAIRAAGDHRERNALIALALVSSLLGPAILFGLSAGFSGDNSRLLEIVLTLLLPGLIGASVAVGTRVARPALAFFIAIWGAVFLPGAYVLLVIAAFAIGTGCFS
jgi:hypothetical protein